MKIKYVVFSSIICMILSACNTSLSETALQTAVSEAIMTSSADNPIETEITDVIMTPMENMVPKEELDNLQFLLEEAQIELTQQAEAINELQTELEGVYILLTPTNTTEPSTITETPQSTITPFPTETQTGGLLYNQKYVITTGSTPVYTYEKENDAGFPIMYKTDPIRKFDSGVKIIVNRYPVRADGGLYYYLVVGPQHGGYYILVDNVQDYTG